jgi:hypothetical protein
MAASFPGSWFCFSSCFRIIFFFNYWFFLHGLCWASKVEL